MPTHTGAIACLWIILLGWYFLSFVFVDFVFFSYFHRFLFSCFSSVFVFRGPCLSFFLPFSVTFFLRLSI